MSDLDPDHVEVLTAQLHAVLCLPATAPNARWSPAHPNFDRRVAGRLLERLHGCGYTLATLEDLP